MATYPAASISCPSLQASAQNDQHFKDLLFVCLFVEGNDGNINLYAGQNQTYVNGFINGNVVDLSQAAMQQQQQGVIPTNLIAVCEFVRVMSCVCLCFSHSHANYMTVCVWGGGCCINPTCSSLPFFTKAFVLEFSRPLSE